MYAKVQGVVTKQDCSICTT